MWLKNIFNGDKVIWIIATFLACISCLVVFSCASSINHLFSHIFHLISGFFLMFIFSKTHYKYLTNGSILFFVFSIILLTIVLLKPLPNIDGAIDARRWINIFGLNFQPSELAKFSLVLLLSRNLSVFNHNKMSLIEHVKYFYFPILLVVALIFKTNGSTALIILASSFIILFISDFNIKNLLKFYAFNIILVVLGVFLLSQLTSNSRVGTWESRINNYLQGEDTYQVNIAKKAISTGKWNGLGPGKSVQKHVLPHASSDFIYAILIEEYSIIGGLFILSLYLIFLVRVITISSRIKLMFPYLLLLGLGILIVVQAFLNIGVSLGIMPVTGQTLPLVSKGGSSIWITCISIGIILNITSQYKKNIIYD
tara:strand:- start:1304 stop:2407 length:1104 start_codon:yes stop_codon:yes gene_type:complete